MDEDKKSDKNINKVPPRAIGEQPGGLRGETRMTIQTRQAQKLILGRKRSRDVQPIIGLLDFGRRMKVLWLSSQVDDPYADWYLIKIEESINEAKALIVEKKQWLDSVLNSMNGFEIDVAQSIEPIQVDILFQNPYGYIGAYLVAEYDELCCSVFTASHIGLIDRKMAASLTGVSGKAIRRTFELAAKWKFTGVTRDDIIANNPVSINAIEAYGECPSPILERTKRAKIAPEIRVKTKPVVVIKKVVKKDNVKEIKPSETKENKGLEESKGRAGDIREQLFGAE